MAGGLFLIAKATYEIHHMMEGPHDGDTSGRPTVSVAMVLVIVLWTGRQPHLPLLLV